MTVIRMYQKHEFYNFCKSFLSLITFSCLPLINEYRNLGCSYVLPLNNCQYIYSWTCVVLKVVKTKTLQEFRATFLEQVLNLIFLLALVCDIITKIGLQAFGSTEATEKQNNKFQRCQDNKNSKYKNWNDWVSLICSCRHKDGFSSIIQHITKFSSQWQYVAQVEKRKKYKPQTKEVVKLFQIASLIQHSLQKITVIKLLQCFSVLVISLQKVKRNGEKR